jgi:pimeloyl-ACP methyl ester carboxylesterase
VKRSSRVGQAALALATVAIAVGLATRRTGDLSGFTTEEGARRYVNAYDEVLAIWPVGYGERNLPTPFGDTHIIVCGPETAPALLLLHATGTSSTGWLLNVGPLNAAYRVYAVDIVGEAGKSHQSRLLHNRADCVAWFSAVLDGLGLDTVRLAGWSFGGWPSLNFLLAAPELIERAVLIAPYASLAPSSIAVLVGLIAVLVGLKVGPYLPIGPPGRLSLRLMTPDFDVPEPFAHQFALGGRYFRASNPRRSVFPPPTRRRSCGPSLFRPCCWWGTRNARSTHSVRWLTAPDWCRI